jgi:hypothetical protein
MADQRRHQRQWQWQWQWQRGQTRSTKCRKSAVGSPQFTRFPCAPSLIPVLSRCHVHARGQPTRILCTWSAPPHFKKVRGSRHRRALHDYSTTHCAAQRYVNISILASLHSSIGQSSRKRILSQAPPVKTLGRPCPKTTPEGHWTTPEMTTRLNNGMGIPILLIDGSAK